MADAMGTIQFETSDQNVLIHLSVLDKEEEMAGITGRGFVVLPVFFFKANKGQQPGKLSTFCSSLLYYEKNLLI